MSLTHEAATGIYLSSLTHQKAGPTRPASTSQILDGCIQPLLERDIAESVSWAVNPVVFAELQEYKTRNPKGSARVDRVLESLRERELASGIAMPFGKIKVPQLPLLDMEAVIKAGLDRFPSGAKPKIFSPYASYSSDSLRYAAKYGASAFICDPQDIESVGPADNTALRVALERYYYIPIKKGPIIDSKEQLDKEHEKYSDGEKRLIEKSIIAIPIDREVSGALAYQDKKDPAQFIRNYYLPRMNGLAPNDASHWRNLTMTDGLTYGLWSADGDAFLEAILKSGLPGYGIQPVPLGRLQIDPANLPEARFKGGTAWHASGADNNLIYDATLKLNEALTWVIKDTLRLSNPEYVRFLSENLGAQPKSPGTHKGEYLEYSLLKAKRAALRSLRLPEAPTEESALFRRNYKLGLQAIKYIEQTDLTGTARDLRESFVRDSKGIVAH